MRLTPLEVWPIFLPATSGEGLLCRFTVTERASTPVPVCLHKRPFILMPEEGEVRDGVNIKTTKLRQTATVWAWPGALCCAWSSERQSPGHCLQPCLPVVNSWETHCSERISAPPPASAPIISLSQGPHNLKLGPA
ncbi:hypothetical protein SKAU_G00326960 [Synaphobranchus kaupii]|uniref:Uncharacterized protein n=1 Tax=Synaphobranchus kaupii TaxID=118154 RepID=A0A9Q1EQ00_SYNKA|nr:hypothetical protein SKAU_G00326960 [Synaphobranchus kaupii]